MRVYAQTPSGFEYIELPDPAPQPPTELERIRDDLALIKAKLAIV